VFIGIKQKPSPARYQFHKTIIDEEDPSGIVTKGLFWVGLKLNKSHSS